MIVTGNAPAQRAPTAQSRGYRWADLVLVAMSMLFIIALALLWRNLAEQAQSKAAYEATIAEIALRDRLQQLDEGTIRLQVGTLEQSLDSLRATIPSAQQAQAELARYHAYAVECGVSLQMDAGSTTRHDNGPGSAPELITQRWTIRARGQGDSVIRFLDRVATGRFATWRIENVVLKPDESGLSAMGIAIGTVDIVVYSYADLGAGARSDLWSRTLSRIAR